MRYKLCKFCDNHARDTPLRGVYIPDFGQIWVKISILGVLHPCRCTDGGEIWHGGGDLRPLLHAKFHPHRCNVSPLRGEKPQNRPLSKLNTGRFAVRAMLPVKKQVVLSRWLQNDVSLPFLSCPVIGNTDDCQISMHKWITENLDLHVSEIIDDCRK